MNSLDGIDKQGDASPLPTDLSDSATENGSSEKVSVVKRSVPPKLLIPKLKTAAAANQSGATPETDYESSGDPMRSLVLNQAGERVPLLRGNALRQENHPSQHRLPSSQIKYLSTQLIQKPPKQSCPRVPIYRPADWSNHWQAISLFYRSTE